MTLNISEPIGGCAMPDVSLSRARELLKYNHRTGMLTWRVPRGKMRRGQLTGTCLDSHGYGLVRVDGRLYRAHRLVWLICRGRFPSGEIDHQNHNKTDNRLSNLRDCDSRQNNMNSARRSNNTSGTTGVHRHRVNRKWVATIFAGGKKVNLGSFANKKEAIKARKAAEKQYGFHPNHGRE